MTALPNCPNTAYIQNARQIADQLASADAPVSHGDLFCTESKVAVYWLYRGSATYRSITTSFQNHHKVPSLLSLPTT